MPARKTSMYWAKTVEWHCKHCTAVVIYQVHDTRSDRCLKIITDASECPYSPCDGYAIESSTYEPLYVEMEQFWDNPPVERKYVIDQKLVDFDMLPMRINHDDDMLCSDSVEAQTTPHRVIRKQRPPR